jgi:alanyl-tRNA synthetase
VLRLGDSSVELCGGTHVARTGDIGVFKITHEGGVASGVRRIEAVTGAGAMEWINAKQRALNDLAEMLRSTPEQAAVKVEQLLKQNKELEKKLATAKHALITGQGSDQDDNVREIAGIKVLVSRMDGVDAKSMRDAVDRAKDKLQNAIVVFASVDDGKVRLAAGVTKNNTDKIKAGDLIRPVAEQVGGKGGGRPDFAQAGGNDPSKLDQALNSVPDWVAEKLS